MITGEIGCGLWEGEKILKTCWQAIDSLVVTIFAHAGKSIFTRSRPSQPTIPTCGSKAGQLELP